MIGKMQQKTLSKSFQTESLKKILEIVLLMGVGALAIALRARLRMGLNMPGHHGIYFMALIFLARKNSKLTLATTLTSMGTGLLLLAPFLGFKDPMQAAVYILPGVTLDLLFILLPQNRKQSLWLLALACGAAWMSIPLVRLFIHIISGMPFDSFLKHGYFYPLFAWFMAGSIGGFAGAGIQIISKRLLKKHI